MLRLIYKTIYPTTIVGFDPILKKIKQSCLSNHNNCVKEMLTMIKSHFSVLAANGKEPSNHRRLLLDSLATGPNHDFNNYIQRIQDDVESGIGVYHESLPDTLINAARSNG